MPLDFSSGGTPVQTGVLDFSSQGTLVGGKPKKTPQQVMQEVAAAQASRDVVSPPETQGLIGQIAAGLETPVRVLNSPTLDIGSAFSLAKQAEIMGGRNYSIPTAESYPAWRATQLRELSRSSGGADYGPGNTAFPQIDQRLQEYFKNNILGRKISQPGLTLQDIVSVLNRENVAPVLQPVQEPSLPSQVVGGVVGAGEDLVGGLLSFLTSPAGAVTAGAGSVGPVVQNALKAAFGASLLGSAVQGGQETIARSEQGDVGGTVRSGLGTAIGGGLGAHLLKKGVKDAWNSRVLTAEIVPPLQRPVAPAGRQLQAPEQSFIDAEVVVPPRLPAPGERPTMPTGSPLDRPAGAARFGVDPIGKAVDISQLSPKEQIELYRGPKEFVPREQYVRPSQESLVILGGQQTQAPMIYGPRPVPLDVAVSDNKSRNPKLYRGTTLEQWQAIQRGEQPQSLYTTQGNTWATTSLESAKGYTRETGKNAVIIEYKDSAHNKVKRLTDDLGDHRRQGALTLDDVQRVTDGEGNVIYEASNKSNNLKDLFIRHGSRQSAPSVLIEPGQAFTPKQTVEGGKVSFAAPAEQGAIPSARQSALPQAEMPKREVVFQNETAPEAPAKPVVAKLSTSGNEPKSGGIGGGIKDAVDKNKEAGSVENPFAWIVDKFKNKEKKKRGETFALSGPRIALDPKESGFKDVTKKVDAQQLWNRVKNKLTPAERDIYEKNGVDKMIVGMGKVSPEEAAQMLQDNGVEVQTHSYGMEGKVSEAKKEYDTLSHSFYDNLTQVKKKEIDDIWYRAYQSQDDIGAFMRELSEKGFTKEEQVNAKRYFELGVQLRRDGGAGVEGPRATSAYVTVSAFSTKEPMPEWTKTRGGKNVQRVDVVVPPKPGYQSKAEQMSGDNWKTKEQTGVLWQPDNLHENLPNTIGWAMIQYKNGPKGEKVAVVVEAQSRWGQQARERGVKKPNITPDQVEVKQVHNGWEYKTPDGNTSVVTWAENAQEAKEYGAKEYNLQPRAVEGHPLLRDYNRLILKAAIDQARKEGATHIMVSDAQTAMMTEGHDRVPTVPRETRVVYENNDRESVASKHNTLQEQNPDKSYTISNNGKQVLEVISTGKKEISQEPGMRLNYDTILPKIMEELSGSKGERVSLGEHKNAFLKEKTEYDAETDALAAQPESEARQYADEVYGAGNYDLKGSAETGWEIIPDQSKARENLIFRNPDGTPKTDVSGTMYKIPQTDKKFSVFEKDRPESVAGRLYINPVGPMAKQALKDIKKLGNGINETSAKLKEYFKGATDKVLPDLVFQNDNPLPDFQPKELANKIFSQPFGSEKIPVLGRMMGGKARLRTPQDDAVAAWYAERHGVGPAVASSVGEQIRGQIKEVFKVSKNGDLNVTPTKAGQSLKMSDVFEALRRDPMAYELTVPQRKVFKRIIEPITQRMTELANKYKIIDEVVDESGDLRAYYPRIVTKHPKLEDKKNTSAFKTRAFNTEKEGWERGYEYELDPEKRLVTGVERLYRAIANKRLATDPILGAKSEVQLKAEIKQAYAEKLATGEITQSKIDRIAEGIRTRGQVMQPILIRAIFDPETAKMLNKEFAAEQSTVRNAITSANSLMKATQLGFDLGVGQIQLLPLLYSNPKVWATAIYDSAKGMVNPEFFATYVRANKEAVNELAQLGSSVGRLQEHMSGLGGETILGKTPVVGQVAQAFGRQFQTAMDVAKVELWKSLREGTPKKEWPKLVRAVETALLSGRSESAMVPHGRALLERVALLAPSYYRGAVEHIAALGERGASGKVVRRSMGRFILGSAITFYAVAKALEMSDEEIKEGFNPMNTSFMTWKVKQEDGSVVNIGFGGIFRSFLKLGGNIIKTSQEHPENWKSLSSEKNPLTRWYRGHAGPTASMAWDAFSGEDFLGRETSLGTIAKGRLPLLAQEALRRPEEPPATALDFGASTFGLTTTPESYSNRLEREQNNLSLRMFGKEFRDLNFSQRSEVEEDLKGIMKKAPRGMTEDRAVDLAIKNQKDVIKNIKDNLGEENRKWLEKHNLKVGGFQNTFEIKGRVIRLTKDEREEMKKLMVEEYEKTLDELRVDPRLKGRSEEEMQRYVSVYLERARKGVWGKMNEKAGKK